jgi:GPH family glycoside/pentoside/hexuronide:cation symporter
MHPTIETKPSQLSLSTPVVGKNSPIAYGFGSFGLASLYKVFAGFYMFYYIDKLGLAIALAAIINVIFGIWDALNDPLVGFLSDNTRSRWGRRKPWLFVGLPFFVSILIMVYAIPRPFLQGKVLFWYALIIFFLFEGAYTVMDINYAALFPELFQNLKERSRASSYYQGLSMFGELVGFAIPPFIYSKFGFVPMALSFAGVAGIILFLAIIQHKEDPKVLKTPPLYLSDAFNEVLKDRPFLWFSIALTFLTFTTGVYTLATPFWVKYTIGASPQVTSLIFTIVFLVAILSVSIWSRSARTLGIKRTWLASVCVMIASAIILGLASNLVTGAIGAAVAGAGLGGVKVCRELIMANFVDINLHRTGHRREGIYYSLMRVMGKLSKILESLALVLLGVLFGYTSGVNPGPQPGNAFRFLISVFPLVFTCVAWLIVSRISFDYSPALPHPGSEQIK